MSLPTDLNERYLLGLKRQLPLMAGKIKFFYEDYKSVEKLPMIVRDYYSNAVGSFLTTNFLASIATSSASVEVAINFDGRMADLCGEIKEWLNLNVWLLRRAKERGLPVDKLLVQEDSLELGKVWFIVRRNKFAHGEIYLPTSGSGIPLLVEKDKEGYVKAIRVSSRPETMALQQLMSAHEFLKALSF